MRVNAASPRANGVESATVHALGWLVLGNVVGLLMATLLLFPELNGVLGGATYGRWAPVHHHLVLYGWCALPLVGVLLRVYGGHSGDGRLQASAVSAWSGSLVLASAASILGHGGGKTFLEWTGPAKLAFVASATWLWIVLAREFLVRRRPEPVLARAARGVLLAGLAGVPILLWWVTSPEVQPPVNPDSGGPTGTSLLGSTLVVAALIALAPGLCGVRSRSRRSTSVVGIAFAIHLGWFLLLDHGNTSHHDAVQIATLTSVVVWLPLLAWHLLAFDWPRPARRWLAASGVWGSVLLASAVPAFLPGVLERVKFTDVLVGHAHLAMGGFVTSVLVVLSIASNRETRLHDLFASRASFAVWHAGCGLMIVAVTCAGWFESADPGALYRSSAAIDRLYALRWLAGAMMLLASVDWARSALRSVRVARATSVPAFVRHEAA
jgi:cytochrome c oxidase cbb3-type subunit 1